MSIVFVAELTLQGGHEIDAKQFGIYIFFQKSEKIYYRAIKGLLHFLTDTNASVNKSESVIMPVQTGLPNKGA